MSISKLVAAILVLGSVNLTAQADDIVLGMSAAFRGPSRGLGIELYRGSMAYFDQVNRAGGVHGRKIVIKALDDGYNPIPAIDNTVQFLEYDEPLLLYGYVGTPTVTRVLPLLKLYEKRHTYLFFPFTGAQPQRQPPYEEFAFNLRASYFQETAGLVDNFVKLGRKRIAMLYQVDAYGRGGWDGVRRALARHRLSIVEEATYVRGTPFRADFGPHVAILKKAEPDAIICIGAYAACAAFLRDARESGWDVPIANISFVGSENLLGLLLDAGKAHGKDHTRNMIHSQVVPNYRRDDLPAAIEYRKLLDGYRGMPEVSAQETDYQAPLFSDVSFEGFLNAKLLVEILRKLGKDADRSRLRSVVETMGPVELGIDVKAEFRADRHQGLDRVYYATVEDGRFVQLDDWSRWKK
jgi:ABC-type branched-subunit amino acid transport system substrate-binding protein